MTRRVAWPRLSVASLLTAGLLFGAAATTHAQDVTAEPPTETPIVAETPVPDETPPTNSAPEPTAMVDPAIPAETPIAEETPRPDPGSEPPAVSEPTAVPPALAGGEPDPAPGEITINAAPEEPSEPINESRPAPGGRVSVRNVDPPAAAVAPAAPDASVAEQPAAVADVPAQPAVPDAPLVAPAVPQPAVEADAPIPAGGVSATVRGLPSTGAGVQIESGVFAWAVTVAACGAATVAGSLRRRVARAAVRARER